MRVKIGNKIYNSNDEPIMIILEDYNKDHIYNMAPEATKYCEFPDTITEEEVKEFMKI